MNLSQITTRLLFIGICMDAMAWHMDGTVLSTKGGVVPDALVSVVDSSGINPVITDAQGAFAISHQAPTMVRGEQYSGHNPLSYRITGNSITIQAPMNGEVRLNLVDPSGRVLWNKSIAAVAGFAHAQIPEELLQHTAYLTIQDSKGMSQPTALARKDLVALTPSAFPRLLVHKEGFQDTTYQMLSDSITSANIVLRDTTSPTLTCPAQVLQPGDHQKTIQVKGDNRTYILHVPAAYHGNQPVPLVVDFHPLGGSGSGEMNASPYKGKTDPEGVITAYPDGKKGPSQGAWNVGPCCVSNADDTAFARALVAEVKQTACIDPKRVYAVGFSMGGGMSHYSACHLADIFAAVAPAAFDLLEQNQGACSPARPIPVLSFRSTGDFMVNYNGGASSVVSGMPITFLGAQATLQKWAQINQCSGSPTAADANGCSTYENCTAGVKVTLCTKQGGGHDYGDATIGWPWLKQFTLP